MSRYSRHNPEEPIRHDWTAGGRKPEAQGSFAAPTGLAGVKNPKRSRHKFMKYCNDCGMLYSQCQCWDAVNHIN